MVHKINNNSGSNEINDCFFKLIQENIENRKQSIIFVNNSNTILVNSRHNSVRLDDEALKIYDDDQLKYIIDINSVIAVVTK